jgi:hypothetical protein
MICLLLMLTASLSAQDSRPYYFYHALPYGSQATYNPLNVIINGGYGILQLRYYEDDLGHRILDYPYREWWLNVWQTVGHPIRTINEFGWKRFITTEVVPLTARTHRNQWVPNYFLHCIGGGVHYRATEEWFRCHGFGCPRLWSIGTMVVYHMLSETVENRGNEELTVDHLADLLIFDPLGIWLFTYDGVCRFFSEKLHLTEWSMQPAYNLSNADLENMGQFYVVKYPLSRSEQWNFMIHFGLHGMAGICHQWPNGNALSLTGGFLVEELIRAEQEGEGRALTATLTWRLGMFFDRNNSLLASLMVTTVPENRIRFNIYPGLFRLGRFTPGFFLSGTKEWVVGINVSYIPLGVAGTIRNN